MKTYSDNYQTLEQAPNKEPRFVVQISWDADDTDHTYLTSSSDAALPTTSPAVDSIHDAVLDISGQTQKINPDIATSTIGSVSVLLSDVTDDSVSPVLPVQITTRMNTKLANGDGLRGKIVRVYVGYETLPFTDYDLRLTYIIDSVTYKDGIYKLKISDIQRTARHKIFTPDETTLNSTIDETQLIIPVTSVDTSLFPTVVHGSDWTVRPNQTVAYIKIEKEVICITGGISFDTTNGWHLTAIERGALNTRKAMHEVSAESYDNRKPKITEHVYFEGFAPKVIYAILTGELLNGNSPENTLPDHWHLGIDTAFVRLLDFQAVGLDLWNPNTDKGRRVRIENPGTQDGKKYIEKELLLWCGAFMPVYSTGEIGIKRLANILSDSSYEAVLDVNNIKSYSDLTHSMLDVLNDIRVKWNYVDSKDEFTKDSFFIDSTSISKHGTADTRNFEFKTVHTGLHTDEDLLTYFDALRDRYSGPPLIMSLNLMPSMSNLEVGDTVRITLEQVRDFNVGTTLDRTFEIQQVSTNWATGALSVKLFGSSQRADEIQRTSLSSVVNDSHYTALGTELSTVLTIVAGVVTVSGTLTGHTTDIDNTAAIYYYDGDLTIGSGVTVTITENVQLRIKGALDIIGTIDGKGNGATAGAATTLLTNAATFATYDNYDSAVPVPDIDDGEQGYFGIPLAPWSVHFTFVIGINSYGTTSGLKKISALPWMQLENDQQAAAQLTGYPAQLRGNAGRGGTPVLEDRYISNIPPRYRRDLRASGGAGGNGGAGLMIVCRGMSFTAAGYIDLSGDDSSVGGSYAWPVAPTKTWYGSAGAPGAPGALLILIDGQYTNPDINETRFIANYGDCPAPFGALEIGDADLGDGGYVNPIINWPYPITVYNGSPHAANENTEAWSSAHRIIYIPPDETPQPEAERVPPPTLHEKYFVQSAKPEPNGASANDRYGEGLAVSNDGNFLVMGTQYAGSAGEIQIHKRNEWTYSFMQQLTGSAASATGNIGPILAMDENANNLIFPGIDTIANWYLNWYSRAGVTFSSAGSTLLTHSLAGLTRNHRLFKGSYTNQWCILGNPLANATSPSVSNSGIATILFRDETLSPVAYVEHSFVEPPTNHVNGYFSAIVTISGDGQTCAGMEIYDVDGDGVIGAWHIFTLDDTASPASWSHDHTVDFQGATSMLYAEATEYHGVLNEDGTTFIFSESKDRLLHILEKHDGVWIITQSFDAPDVNGVPTNTKKRFGGSMDLSSDGRTLSVASRYDIDDAGVEVGAVHIYRKVEQVWRYDQALFPLDNDVANDGVMGDQCQAMNNNGTMVIVDRQQDDNGGANQAGAVHCFESKLAR